MGTAICLNFKKENGISFLETGISTGNRRENFKMGPGYLNLMEKISITIII